MQNLALTSFYINSIWVLGLSAAVATISYANWLRKFKRTSWHGVFSEPALSCALHVSFLLFCLGQLLVQLVLHTEISWWRVAIWVVLLLFIALHLLPDSPLARRHVTKNMDGRL